MATRLLYGAWQTVGNAANPAGVVFADTTKSANLGNAVAKSPGVVRVSQVLFGPKVTQHWTLLGWSVRLSLVYIIPISPAVLGPYCARMGKLWAGLATQSQQTNQGGLTMDTFLPLGGGAQFPPDLSTFDVVWTQDDEIAAIVGWDPGNAPLPSGALPSIVAKTFMFPSPVPIDPSAQMQMQLVLTPSLYYLNGITCTSGSWSVIYDDGDDKR